MVRTSLLHREGRGFESSTAHHIKMNNFKSHSKHNDNRIQRNRKSKALLITVKFASSSENFLAKIKDRLARFALLQGGCITKGDGCKYLVYSRNDSRRIFGYLYDKIDDDIYLKRKYNKFSKIFNN